MTKQCWQLIFESKANKLFQKLDKPIQVRIQKYLDRVLSSSDPRSFGESLEENLAGFWKYRVGNYRIICKIEDDQLVVVVVKVDHRSKVYKSH